jgi:hypothetical protein
MRRGTSAPTYRRQQSTQLGLAAALMPNTEIGETPVTDSFVYSPAKPGTKVFVIDQKIYNERFTRPAAA